MSAQQVEPSGTDMTDHESAVGGTASQQSTKSSNGRKLRQVLQKKQLEVLLQTYSSFIEENEDSKPKDMNDLYSISRKKSLEGNPTPRVPDPKVDTRMVSNNAELFRTLTNPDIRRMRRSESLISIDEGDRNHVTHPTSDSELSDGAVVDAKKTKNSSKDDSNGRRHKKRHVTKRKKKGNDFASRFIMANDVIMSFSNRCGRKQLEIVEDFREATKELRHHLKSGANMAFEDLADQFDGIVENLFVDVDDRDDDSDRLSREEEGAGFKSTGSPRQSEPISLRGDSSTRYLTHEETIETMNQQVNELLEPVATILTTKVNDTVTCLGGLEVEAFFEPESEASAVGGI